MTSGRCGLHRKSWKSCTLFGDWEKSMDGGLWDGHEKFPWQKNSRRQFISSSWVSMWNFRRFLWAVKRSTTGKLGQSRNLNKGGLSFRANQSPVSQWPPWPSFPACTNEDVWLTSVYTGHRQVTAFRFSLFRREAFTLPTLLDAMPGVVDTLEHYGVSTHLINFCRSLLENSQCAN